MGTSESTIDRASNLVVLRGEVTTDPVARELADGVAWEFDVATSIDVDGTARRFVVPVNWLCPAASEVEAITAGLEVMVIGTIRRRFFRSGGRTLSRTEVVPDRVVPCRRRAAVRNLLADAVDRLAD